MAVISEARRELIIVAPYIKLNAFKRLLDGSFQGIPIKLLTRWNLDELGSGVSDIEIWDLLKNRSDSEFWIKQNLHAKYYRGDKRCLVGSANLTSAGMNWCNSPNLEILVELNSEEWLVGIEQILWDKATRVTQELYDFTKKRIPSLDKVLIEKNELDQQAATISFYNWRPQLRFPEDLFKAYSSGVEAFSTASSQAAKTDLQALSLPSKLTKQQFEDYIALTLRQHPEFQAITKFGIVSRRFGEMRQFLERRGVKDAERQWQTWLRWLAFFFPDNYSFSQPGYSEIFKTII